MDHQLTTTVKQSPYQHEKCLPIWIAWAGYLGNVILLFILGSYYMKNGNRLFMISYKDSIRDNVFKLYRRELYSYINREVLSFLHKSNDHPGYLRKNGQILSVQHSQVIMMSMSQGPDQGICTKLRLSLEGPQGQKSGFCPLLAANTQHHASTSGKESSMKSNSYNNRISIILVILLSIEYKAELMCNLTRQV